MPDLDLKFANADTDQDWLGYKTLFNKTHGTRLTFEGPEDRKEVMAKAEEARDQLYSRRRIMPRCCA